MQPLLNPPILFAHRGGYGDAPEASLEAFESALGQGATGLEGDIWLTSDGVAVINHDGSLRSDKKGGWRILRRKIRAFEKHDLPEHIPTLHELYERCGTAFELSLDMKDPSALTAVMQTAVKHGDQAVENLWICLTDIARPESVPAGAEGIHWVNSTRLHHIKEGPEKRAATLAANGFNAINLHVTDWTAGLVALFHRFELYAFAWGARHEHEVRSVLSQGVDAVYSDYVNRMMAASEQTDVERRPDDYEGASDYE